VRIALRFDAGSRELQATVGDDGQGIDGQGGRAGLGLVGLRERIEMLGGRFRVDSAPGRGTTVSACIPFTVSGITA
jgi:signal transduction histidine kinase